MVLVAGENDKNISALEKNDSVSVHAHADVDAGTLRIVGPSHHRVKEMPRFSSCCFKRRFSEPRSKPDKSKCFTHLTLM